MHFKPDDIKNLNEGQDGLERLRELGNVWKGGDVALEGVRVIQPDELIQDAKIVINKNNLPPIKIDRGVLGQLKWSVRSFLAQSGVDITFHKGNVTDEMLKEIEEGKDAHVPVNIYNYGERAVEIEGKVFRFFYTWNRLRGDELREILDKELIIEGEEGKDWFVGDTEWDTRKPDQQFPSPKGEEICIVVPLSKMKYYIPYSPEPIKPRDNKNRLKDILEPVPEGMKLDFQIGETPHIKLSENLTAVIPTHSYGGAHHIHSPLIDGGSDWPIRTETFGLDFVEFYIYRNK
jgi:hypothetical protein